MDPSVENGKGNDIGSQYRTGIYYTNDKVKNTVERIAGIEKNGCDRFCIEIGPLSNFYTAEEYHQNYLENTPRGYCHIPWKEMKLFADLRIDPEEYCKPAARLSAKKCLLNNRSLKIVLSTI